MGAGRTELAMSAFGRSYGQRISGQALLHGREVDLSTVTKAIDHRIAYVTEDRKSLGLVLDDSIAHNTTLAHLDGVSRHGVIDEGRECQDIVTQLAAVSKALDRAGFAVIALGLRQCISDPEGHEMDVDTMEKLFLSLA